MNPADPPPGQNRRAFLIGAGRLAGLAGLAGAGVTGLAGCGKNSAAAVPHVPRPADPRHPVLWPIAPWNKPIPGGLQPEHNTTLRILSWPGRISQRCAADFSKAFKCAVEINTFTTINQGIGMLARGHGRYDLLAGAPSEVVGTLVTRYLVQPLNHSYIPYIRQAWPIFKDPYYDSRWRYTVPFGVYTTGIAWRKDKVDLDPYSLRNGWQFPWVAKVAGRTSILDDYRQSLGLAMLTSDPKSFDTADPYLIDIAKQRLLNLNRMVGGLRIDNRTARQIATSQSWVHLAFSGQAVAAAKSLPPGVPIDAVGFWFPPDGGGPVMNDTFTVARRASNPVLAHKFCNFMLGHRNAVHNIAATGFTQPLDYAAPHRLIEQGILPPSLSSAAVSSTFFDHGLKETELQPPADELWREAWTAVTRQVNRTT